MNTSRFSFFVKPLCGVGLAAAMAFPVLAETPPNQGQGPAQKTGDERTVAEELGRSESDKAVPITTPALLWKLHHINQYEMKLGVIATKRAKSSRVRDYGKQLSADHHAGDKSVIELARKQGITFEEKDVDERTRLELLEHKMDLRKQKITLEYLKRLQGDAFDREFIVSSVEGHENAMKLVQLGLDTTKDEAVKALLQELLPKLRNHREVATSIQSDLRTREAKTPKPRG